MSNYISGVANSIVAGKTIVVSDEDAVDKTITIDFGIDEKLTVLCNWAAGATGVVKEGLISSVESGVVTISSEDLVSGDEIRVVVVREKV